MASDPTTLISDLWEIKKEIYTLNAQAALVVYEYAITINQELTFIWKRKLTGATALFVANRYLLVLLTIIQITPSLPIEWCVVSIRLAGALVLLQLAVFAVFSALRVYAIWDRNTMFFVVVLLPNLVPFATNFYSDVVDTPVYLGAPLDECGSETTALPSIDARLEYATRISVIVADALVLFLTWWKTFKDAREVLSLKMNISLTTLLIRDGTTYFCLLLILNVLVIVTTSTGEPLLPLVTCLSSILISRFMLNLRQAGEGAAASALGTRPGTSMPVFAIPESRIMGNLGEPLQDFEFDSGDSEPELDAEPRSAGHIESVGELE